MIRLSLATALLVGYCFACILAVRTGMGIAQPSEMPEMVPLTTQAHYSVHARILEDGAIQFIPFCGEYEPPKEETRKRGRQMQSDEARDMQIVDSINEITDRTCEDDR